MYFLYCIRFIQTESLSSPYGTCIEDAQRRSHCELECKAADVCNLCGCHPEYYPETENGNKISIAFELTPSANPVTWKLN